MLTRAEPGEPGEAGREAGGARARAGKRALMVAFHFPPQRGSSGVQRTLAFARHLPALGWQPLILTAHPRAHPHISADQLGDIPPGTVVRRAFAVDTARHLSWRGRYLAPMALPDRWSSWLLGALPAGLALARRMRPALIWSTYPIATAHLIGMALQRLTGLPWVAEMRDPMTDADYPAPGPIRRAYQWVEAATVRRCTRLVCTTPGAIAAYRQRFPEVAAERYVLIENGYDEAHFADAAAQTARPQARGPGPVRMVHSGVVYPSERDPVPLLTALSALKGAGTLTAARFQLTLRAPGHEDYLAPLIVQYGVSDLVQIAPHLPYREALAEMLGADALLLMQASNCNAQIPAKLYEYMRAGRPVLALTDARGDTAAAMHAAGLDTMAALDDAAAIAEALLRFIVLVEQGRAPLAGPAAVAAASRAARSARLAALFDELTGTAAAPPAG